MSSVDQIWEIFEAQPKTIIDLRAMLQEDVKQTGSDDRTKWLEDMITKATTETTAARSCLHFGPVCGSVLCAARACLQLGRICGPVLSASVAP
ncbi:unnamed protein product [Dibothriocephalus latus]|uniref:Uncharacterized protein n=1 Tax=Dibothriocephalus latus TaxID=60516 RepID=A0A3P7LF62_DIBLA|nr:unnamed protein product [Dibothriocephalus latus]